MTVHDLEPMPPELEVLLRTERAAPAPTAQTSSRVFERIAHSIAVLPPVGGSPGSAAGNADTATDSSGHTPDANVHSIGADQAGTATGGSPIATVSGTGGTPIGTAAATGGAAVGVVKATGATLATGGVAKTAGLLLTSKLVFGTATFVAGGLVGAGVHSAVEPTPKPQIIRVEVPVPTPIEIQTPPMAPPVVAVEPARAPPRPVVTARPIVAAPVRPVPAATSPERDSALASERALLEIARTSLSRQKPEDALEALARYTRRFPNGQLREEADALHVQALVGAGHFDDARDAAKEFKVKYRSSLLAPAVDAAIREIH